MSALAAATVYMGPPGLTGPIGRIMPIGGPPIGGPIGLIMPARENGRNYSNIFCGRKERVSQSLIILKGGGDRPNLLILVTFFIFFFAFSYAETCLKSISDH